MLTTTNDTDFKFYTPYLPQPAVSGTKNSPGVEWVKWVNKLWKENGIVTTFSKYGTNIEHAK